MQVSFNPLAERELNDAAQYYELESAGLGASFLAEAEHTCGRIIAHPEAAPVVLGTIRRRLLRRFPYALLYRLQGDTVRILAVMNLKRRPHYWLIVVNLLRCATNKVSKWRRIRHFSTRAGGIAKRHCRVEASRQIAP